MFGAERQQGSLVAQLLPNTMATEITFGCHNNDYVNVKAVASYFIELID